MNFLSSSQNNFNVNKDISSIEVISADISNTDYTFAIPTYCRAKELAEAVDSIYSQNSNVPFCVLIVDNNPLRNDETEQYVHGKLLEKGNVYYYKNSKNLGMAGNWNRLFELCKTKYLVMLHDDDKLLPNYLDYVHRILTADNNISVLNVEKIYWDGTNDRRNYYVKSHDNFVKYDNFANYWRFTFGPPSGCVFKTEDVIEEGGFCQETYPSIDYAFIQRMCMKRNVLKTTTPLMLYREVGNASSKKETQLMWIEKDFIIREELARLLHIPHWYNRFIQAINIKIRLRGLKKDHGVTMSYNGTKPGGLFAVVLFKLLDYIYIRIYLNELCKIKTL